MHLQSHNQEEALPDDESKNKENRLPFLDELVKMSANGSKPVLLIVDNCEDALAAEAEGDVNGLSCLVSKVIYA